MRLFPAIAGAALSIAIAMPAAAEKLSLTEISRYLNSFQTATSAFTQINDDGTISEGRLLIKRPGRVRFEYKPPEDMLVVSNGDTVGIIDGKSNDGAQGYPLNRTPLSIILARHVDLTRARMVTGHSSDGKTTTVRAQDPAHPDYGSIDLVFTSNPTELRQWVVNDSSGSKTTVILGDLKKDVRIANDNFVIPGIGTPGGAVNR